MAAEFDPARHSRRTYDLVALQDELLDPMMDVERLKSEWSDANLSNDDALAARTDREAEHMKTHSARMTRLWWLMVEAQKSRSEELSESVAEEMRRTILAEHRRRSGVGKRRPRRRATINLSDPKSAARTILSKSPPEYVESLINELGGEIR